MAEICNRRRKIWKCDNQTCHISSVIYIFDTLSHNQCSRVKSHASNGSASDQRKQGASREQWERKRPTRAGLSPTRAGRLSRMQLKSVVMLGEGDANASLALSNRMRSLTIHLSKKTSKCPLLRPQEIGFQHLRLP